MRIPQQTIHHPGNIHYLASNTCVLPPLKVRPHYAAWQNSTECDLAAWQMEGMMWTSMRRGLGRALLLLMIFLRPTIHLSQSRRK